MNHEGRLSPSEREKLTKQNRTSKTLIYEELNFF